MPKTSKKKRKSFKARVTRHAKRAIKKAKDSPEAITKAAQLDKRHQYIDGDGKLRNQVRVKSPDGKVQWRTKSSVLPVEQRLGQTKVRSLIKTRTSDHYLGTKRESIQYSKAKKRKK